jgi:hypothetical protein
MCKEKKLGHPIFSSNVEQNRMPSSKNENYT